ncbi:hypothetical protein [Streptomyces sp. NBC_00151]|nr:hypothetical protein [Streptomyces sp. NBC_00151]WRZ37767.1 hypothetical protein OG915_06715 [Streptomyces sp. NBC_00151]
MGVRPKALAALEEAVAQDVCTGARRPWGETWPELRTTRDAPPLQ